jgi:uncharacterized membrane protein
MMEDLLPITLDDMIHEVRREQAMRRDVYPKLKANAGRNKHNQLDRQFDVMQAVLEHLEAERQGSAQ